MEILTIILVVGLLATTGALLTGIASMARGGEFDRAHSYQLMFARVGLQAITLICLMIALYILL
ncbi:MAG: twin transmembrane helix small protein [Acidiferrobacterales bacterium]